MALTQTQTLPAPFLTDVTKDYAKRLGATTAPALDTSKFAPTRCTTRSLSNRSLW